MHPVSVHTVVSKRLCCKDFSKTDKIWMTDFFPLIHKDHGFCIYKSKGWKRGKKSLNQCLKRLSASAIYIQLSMSRNKLVQNKLTVRSSTNRRPFPSSPGPLYQSEVKCSAFDMEVIFHSHANKTPFHKKICALGLILKARVFGTRKWPIVLVSRWQFLIF